MEDNKMVPVLEKVKAGASAFIGAGILSQGTFYFQKQSSYNVPRILYPIFSALGHVGLAVAMLVLGAALIFWGYSKWKKSTGKISIFAGIALGSFALFFAILFASSKPATPEDLMKQAEENRAKGIEKINSAEKPDFGKPEVEKHFTDFETILQQYKNAKKEENEHAIVQAESDFMKWSETSAALIQKLDTPKQKQAFALYLAKLSVRWQEVK